MERDSVCRGRVTVCIFFHVRRPPSFRLCSKKKEGGCYLLNDIKVSRIRLDLFAAL